MTTVTSGSSAVRMALALLAACALWLLVAPLYRMGFWIEQPNEGWNATHAMNAFTASLYPSRDSFFINNYPPLSFYLSGALARVGGDPVFAGRVVAFISFGATAGAIYLIVRGLGASILAACAAALCFVLILAGLLSSYVGLSEPQMMAHALVAFGAAMLVRAESANDAIAAAILTALGLLTKQVVIALPLASLLWLVIYRRKLLIPWLATGAVAGAGAFLALFSLYGQNFIANMLFPRVLSLSAFGKNLALISKAVVPLAVYGIVAWRLRRERDEAMAFAGFAILAGFATLLLFGGALGVSINIVFDLVIAASIGLGLAWDRISVVVGPAKENGWRLLIAAAILVRVAIGVPYANVAFALDSRERALLEEQSSALETLRDRLKVVSGPVACETLSACIWAGHRNEADLWKLHFETTLGPFMDTAALLKRIAEGNYGAIVLFGNSAPVQDRRLPGLAAALAAGYGPPQVFGGTVSLFLPEKSR